MDAIQLEYLDHVAIRVKDLEVSASWYKRVLGLKRYQFERWGDYPIFLLSGKAGVALFPMLEEEIKSSIDHFAFNVTRANYELAKERYANLRLEYIEKDHYYFHSIYTNDPDGHVVELTTLMVPEEEVYGA